MKSQHMAMTMEEFERLPRPLGWIHEYYGGMAHLRPGNHVVIAQVPVQPRPVQPIAGLRPVAPDDSDALVAAFVASFADSVDYCDCNAARVETSARQCITAFFSGQRRRHQQAEPLPASRLVWQDDAVAGAALVTDTAHGPLLDMLFVVPGRQRQGLATVLVAAALNDLHAAGRTALFSRYLLANEASAAWHQRFGFVAEPDMSLARRQAHRAREELERREQLGDLTPPERAALQAQCAYWDEQMRQLEQIAERDGDESVMPILKYRAW